jgi:TatD DNase family protein
MFADSHVHIHAYADPEGLLERAVAAGVDRIVGISVDLTTARRTLAIARQARLYRRTGTDWPTVIAAVGLHPALSRSLPVAATYQVLGDLAGDPLVGFIGEIGLDAAEAYLALPMQAMVFRAQLGLARQLGKPVNLHVRGAVDAALEILGADGVPERGAVFHYFTGDAELAERLLAAGLFISVGKSVTRPENADLRAAVQDIPLERLLLETDSYPLPGRTTEPREIPRIAQAVAELKGLPIERVAEATTENLRRICGEQIQ